MRTRPPTVHGPRRQGSAALGPFNTPSLRKEHNVRDPDMVIVLAPQDGLDAAELAARTAPVKRITALRAAKQGRVGALSGAKLYSEGPAVLELVTALRDEIQRLQKVTP